MTLTQHFKRIFTFQELISKQQYLLYGTTLMLTKYLGDFLIYYFFLNKFLSILSFLNPLLSSRIPIYGQSNLPFVLVFFLFSLPFFWAGFSLTIRRCIDADKSPKLAFLFFVPYINFILFSFLILLPTSLHKEKIITKKNKVNLLLSETLRISSVCAVLCVITIVVIVYLFETYAGGLFFGLPFVYGFSITLLLNRTSSRSLFDCFKVITLSEVIASGVLLLFAMEGALCIAMAIPIFVTLSFIGSIFAKSFNSFFYNKVQEKFIYSFFIYPILLIALDSSPSSNDIVLREVYSKIIINASPEKVWPSIIEFSELKPPKELIFQLGVAYPIKAVIEGRGVGAVRYCKFSTGDFVEPITKWDEAKELSFNVRYQPKPLKELSPYSNVNAPHLDNFIQSKRGQFKLTAHEGNKTLLEGRTWYTLKITPEPYWSIYSDWFIHKIHLRVLEHIRDEVESKN